jgi:hypothetical protein
MNCDGFYISADFLYWRAENHGFSYAYQVETETPNVGQVVRVSPEWKPAFRVGLGWNTNHDFWDILLNYTWYKNNSQSTATNALGFIPLWPVSTATVGQYEKVTGTTRFMMNMGDFEMGRMVYLTKTVAVRPHLGVRGGTLHQRFSSSFTDRLAGANDAETFKGKNNYWGVGPRAGFNGELHMSQGFSVLGKVAGALLYGKNKVSSLTSELVVDATEYTTERQYTENFYQLVPNMQLSLGLQWQTCFWCESMFFKMSAAWETNYWWEQFNLPSGLAGFNAPLPTVGNQPLTMEGLTLNFEWDF